MSPAKGESVAAEEIAALDQRYQEATVSEEAEDVDVDAFLAAGAAQGAAVMPVAVHLGDRTLRLNIAAIDEEEEAQLQRQARRPGKPGTPGFKVGQLEFSFSVYRRLYVAKSLSKASGKMVMEHQLTQMPPGVLALLQQEIMRLSGYDLSATEGQQRLDPTQFLS